MINKWIQVSFCLPQKVHQSHKKGFIMNPEIIDRWFYFCCNSNYTDNASIKKSLIPSFQMPWKLETVSRTFTSHRASGSPRFPSRRFCPSSCTPHTNVQPAKKSSNSGCRFGSQSGTGNGIVVVIRDGNYCKEDFCSSQVFQLTGHLVYWAKATIIYPLCESNVYVVAPDAVLTASLMDTFSEQFPGLCLLQVRVYSSIMAR